MNKHVNLTSYDDVEKLDNFTDLEFMNYCDEKLFLCEKHLAFIKKMFPKNEKIDICEIGSGNSKLLYKLEQNNMINNAIGIEISRSRYLFAEKFKKYVKSEKVTNINKNIFNVTFEKKFQIIVGVDIVFQLITAIQNGYEEKLLSWIDNNLDENGYLILELWSFESIIKQLHMNDNVLHIWSEFAVSDPFKYVLSDLSIDKDKNIIWNKKFIKRDSHGESFFNNILKPYSKDLIVEILKKHNFKDIKIYDSWDKEDDCEKDEYIVVAKKQELVNES
ncbi:MAG: hypothetical protein HRT41_13225 [Campylobacteraceae bacterium]|nr:hypothetical protein [Campylobacteraceae bacterium]